jgi:hypothetical protein
MTVSVYVNKQKENSLFHLKEKTFWMSIFHVTAVSVSSKNLFIAKDANSQQQLSSVTVIKN